MRLGVWLGGIVGGVRGGGSKKGVGWICSHIGWDIRVYNCFREALDGSVRY
nr:hypothetical protein [uncultured organism]